MFSSNKEDAPKEDTDHGLGDYHRKHYNLVLWALLLGLGAFVYWSSIYKIDEVARATGEVIASSRVQVIQAVDGGVLSKLNVREGDRVKRGQVLAQLDLTRVGAAVKEIEVRLSALKAKTIRLRAEVTGSNTIKFPRSLRKYKELIKIEKALFKQRKTGLKEELRTLQVAVDLSLEEAFLIEKLVETGDANRTEVIRAKRASNDSEAKLINKKNQFLEQARLELNKVEDEIAQNEQILTQRNQQFIDSTFVAVVPGIVKNIRVTTVGGVLRAGDELLQIIPIEDDLIIEAKIRPVDIAQVNKGLEATIRFDPFDYTIFGGVKAKVVYVSSDTLKEDSRQGEEIYYRVHVVSLSSPVVTTSGKPLDILPGMTAQVDIKTGERSVLDFLLKPIKKTLSESFGER